MSWKKLLESVSESLNDHLRLRNDYLLAENRILRRQIDGRVRLTDSERKDLAEMGAKLGKKALEEIAIVASPDTILAWNRKFTDHTVDTSEPRKAVGRPRADKEIEALVVRMARENRSWGYDRIQGALKHLGYTISDQTVGNIIKRHGISPAPERRKTVTWQEFTRSHLDILQVTDLFNGDVWSWLGLIVSCLWRIVHLGRHQVQSVRMPRHQPMQAMQALRRRSLDLHLHVRRWAYLLQERSRAIRVGETVQEQSGSEVALADAPPLRSQDRGKVVHVSAARPRPIRDGPMRHQPRRDWPLNGDGCMAA
jgi:transposase